MLVGLPALDSLELHQWMPGFGVDYSIRLKWNEQTSVYHKALLNNMNLFITLSSSSQRVSYGKTT